MPEPVVNPYESPLDESPLIEHEEAEATEAIRWAQVALWIPALCNLACLYTTRQAFLVPAEFYYVMLFANLAWMWLVGILAWRFGPGWIFAISDRLHQWIGRRSSASDWREALYRAARRSGYAARLGAIVWLLWLYWFFYAAAPGGFVVNAIFLAVGHALGAWIYIPLIYEWLYMPPAEAAQS